jgi:hypothetical protein
MISQRGFRFASRQLAHVNFAACTFKGDLIHCRLHQADAPAVLDFEHLGWQSVGKRIRIKSFSLVLNRQPAYFPTVTLNGTAGFAGTQGSNWFTWPAGFWALGPALAETLFDAGRRRATSESARANYDATVATYRQTSLTAFQEVEDNLAASRILEDEAQQQEQAVASSKDSLHLFTNRYKGGVDTYLQVITAQTTELANERNAYRHSPATYGRECAPR